MPFPVVGIGASAGGIRALRILFEHMPTGSGMAFVVVMHLSPTHESTVDQILGAVTRIPVEQVTGPTRIERDHIYVIPPNRHLLMKDGSLEIVPFPPDQGSGSSIDAFFRTLAATHRERAIAIVLSGSGSDGAVGVKSVKEQGGLIVAQSIADAEHDGMPRSAIATGVVDFVLPAAQIPDRLLQLWRNMQQIRLPGMGELDGAAALPESVEEIQDSLKTILGILRQRTGNDFSTYKQATVLRRIERRLQVNHVADLAAYAAHLRDHPGETRGLLKDMLISVTNFFRDREAFEALERLVIPELFAGKTADDEVRVWVPGCATGEEAFSIAMLLAEAAQEHAAPPAFQVFATDIDEDAIAAGRNAVYPEGIVTDVPPGRLRRFFAIESGGYRIQKAIRERVTFAVHNVLRDAPFSRLDLVSCRNLLIYLNRGAQHRVLDAVRFALRPDAFLFLGSSESVEEADSEFRPIDKSHRIFRARPAPRTPRPLIGLNVPERGGGGAGVSAAAAPARARARLGTLHMSLLERYAPPSVVVDDVYDIVHMSENAGNFLHFGAGEPSLNLPKAVEPALRTDVQTGLFEAFQTRSRVLAKVAGSVRGKASGITIVIDPVLDEESGKLYALVIFDDRPAEQDAEDAADAAGLHPLAAELERTRQQLRNRIEQYETQNEELKASNEELQAINEELRSATEELETSKEELQSTNEELYTVNEQLSTKVAEMEVVNNDLRNFIAATEIGVIFVDRGLRIMRFTPPARVLFNLVDSDVGRAVTDITHRLEYPGLEQDLRGVLDTLRTAEREVSGPGESRYLVRMLPYRTSEDRIDGVVVTLVDVTGRRAAEERARRGEEWMRFVVDSVRDYAILTLDPAGKVNSWNTGAQRMFGYRADEIMGRPVDILFTPEDRAMGEAQDEQRRAREDGRAADERWHIRKDGSRFYCSGVMVPLNDGRFYGYVKVARDLTVQQESLAQRERLLSQERAGRTEVEQLNRQKDQFLAMLSHELRNPLNLILMQAQLLLRSDPFKDPKSRHTAEVIYQTAATQSRLVDDLLDVSRVMTGKLAMQQHLVPLPFIVGDSIGAVAREAEQKQVQLDINLTPEPLIVQADPVRVRQIAWNLLTNAIKFTPAGGHVTVSLKRDGDHARLDVVDSGVGIPPEAVPHIFDMFSQLDLSASRPTGGMGIGLALVRQLVELHNGRIEVHSDGVGKGSRFTVWLPLYIAGDDERRTSSIVEADPAVHRAPREQGNLTLEGLHILVVDDAADAASAVRELLKMDGADVETAVEGKAALQLVTQRRFDVVISDIAMPGLDGLELIRRIRKLPDYRSAAAIACSGFNRRQDVQKALEAGFDAHLTKPIGIRDLVDLIVRLVPRRKR